MRRRLITACFLGVCLTSPAYGETPGLVNILVPGFKAVELPLKLSNINNLRFHPDGRLTALGYDGRIHLLMDTDGDGLEDTASPFWDEPTLTVPVGMAWSNEGLYVSSKGKISFFPDRDKDGRADREEIISTNWPPTATTSGNVDATAITLDPAGNLYFGLITEHYANPYLIKDGVAHYSLESRRGTIQKWSRATKQLETVATGIRVPYQLEFNKHGDLFNTDQEGETWCPNGNPLDELNWIQPGKNYGFPPRHPQHLPNLISEPPVVGFGPQHQSACGFVFNEPNGKQKLFGPSSWEDDAIVAGEGRGKIWRVPLTKTPFGYLGKDFVLARISMLVTDVAISADGHLYVSCHSGKPDWGTGPKGIGKIFRIAYSNSSAPLPAAVWPASSMEVHVAFDKPAAPALTNSLEAIRIEFGQHVQPGDRYEVLKPPYKAVARQDAVPRGKLRVTAASFSEDRRTLILTTDPHPQAVSYAITLPDIELAEGRSEAATADLGYFLNGVETSWAGENGQKWDGWFPHIDSQANRLFTIGSADHEKFYSATAGKGRLEQKTRLHPPEGSTRVRIVAGTPLEVEISGPSPGLFRGTNVILEMPRSERTVNLLLRTETGASEGLAMHAAYNSDEDPTWRVLPFSAFMPQWSPAPSRPSIDPPAVSETLAGGDYERGRALFFDKELQCASCHAIRGRGKALGPDLSNLAHRDLAAVLQDIRDPNATINPDHTAYNLRVKDGTELTGFVRASGATAVQLIDATGAEHIHPRSHIESLQPSAVSLMPGGLIDQLNETQVRDLMTYLMHAPPERNAQEIAAWRKAPVTETHAGSQKPTIKVVLVANKQDHGEGQHDYPHWQTNFHRLLTRSEGADVQAAWEWPTPEQFAQADAIVFYYWNRAWNTEKFAQMDAFLARGGGMVLFHSATIADKEPEELAKRIGLAAQPKTVKYLHAPVTLKFASPPDHPITAGFKSLYLLDEPYWPMIGDTNSIQVLATTMQEEKHWPMMWTFQPGRGRVFVSIAGHYTWTHQDPAFQLLSLRALAWAAGEKSDRFLDALPHAK